VDRASLYYSVRGDTPCDPVRRAARLIFLNRTCYNGLYRVNRRGQFNVPHGRYLRPRIADEPTLRAASAALRGIDLQAGDFAGACALAAPGDFVYLDPPYHPLSRTAHFTSYTAAPFAHAEQLRLRDTFDDLTARGVHAILSNSDHPAIRALYDDRGYTLDVERGAIGELLVSNAPALTPPPPLPTSRERGSAR
jgi:DNA adenine methylase